MFVDSDIAPSGTLLGLLQRGRGDGTLHALAAPRTEALSALWQCVLHDPRRDWQIEHRSLYYARLHMELDAGLDDIERHLFHHDDLVLTDGAEERTGLALSLLGHLVSYGADGADGALRLLRRYAVAGANWQWALDELAVRDDDSGLRALGSAILARFAPTPEGDAALGEAARNAFEPRPWRLWAEDPAHPEQAERLHLLQEQNNFDRWQRQLHTHGPRPGWSVREVLAWAADGSDEQHGPHREAAAARCLAAVAGPEDRPELLAVARGGPDAGRTAALRHLAERGDPEALDLIQAAAADPCSGYDRAPLSPLANSALASFARMRSIAALERARHWAADRDDALGLVAAQMLAHRGEQRDAAAVLSALRRAIREQGPDSDDLWPLVDGVGRLTVRCAAPVLRHIYRETASSQLRGRTARALAATDPAFPAGFAIECLWDCEESTRELAAEHATTGDARVVERLRRLAADPAEQAGVQSAVRGRLSPDAGTPG